MLRNSEKLLQKAQDSSTSAETFDCGKLRRNSSSPGLLCLILIKLSPVADSLRRSVLNIASDMYFDEFCIAMFL